MNWQILMDSIAHLVGIAIIIFLFYYCIIIGGGIIIAAIFKATVKDWVSFFLLLLAGVFIGWAIDRLITIYFPGLR